MNVSASDALATAASRHCARAGTVVLCALLLAGLFATPASAQRGEKLDEQLLVILKDEGASQVRRELDQLKERHGLKVVVGWTLESLQLYCAVVEVSRRGADLEATQQAIADEQFVVSVQPNQTFETHAVTRKPAPEVQYSRELIGFDRAHEVATGRGVRIAIVDTGADVEHKEVRGSGHVVHNFVRQDRREREDRHGTALVGVLAAQERGRRMLLGVAPEARLEVLKACWYERANDDSARCSTYTLALALEWAIQSKVSIINLSLGGPPDPLLEQLVGVALRQGQVVVGAVPENESIAGFPAGVDSVILSRACDPQGEALRSSSPRSVVRPAVVAPGVDVLSTAPRDRYDFYTGHSLAAAHVSGVVALLLEAGVQGTPADLEAALSSRFSREPLDVCAALAASGSACDA